MQKCLTLFSSLCATGKNQVIKNTKTTSVNIFAMGKNKIDNKQPVWHGGVPLGNANM